MGIELIHENGKNKPVILCDECRNSIKNAEEGIVIWDNQDVKFWIYHKGKCDDRKKSKSMDLDVFLEYLDTNCKRNNQQTKKKAKLNEQF
jgi:hypothetical protein